MSSSSTASVAPSRSRPVLLQVLAIAIAPLCKHPLWWHLFDLKVGKGSSQRGAALFEHVSAAFESQELKLLERRSNGRKLTMPIEALDRPVWLPDSQLT